MTDDSPQDDRDSPQEQPVAWSADLLARIVAATEHVEETLDRAPQWDVTMTEFVETVRRRAAQWKDEKDIVRGMVAAALPKWARYAYASPDSIDDLADELTQVLWNNPPLWRRVVSLYSHIRSLHREADSC
jgi:hypothetical protein